MFGQTVVLNNFESIMRLVDVDGETVYVEKEMTYRSDAEWSMEVKSELGLPPHATLQIEPVDDQNKMYRVTMQRQRLSSFTQNKSGMVFCFKIA